MGCDKTFADWKNTNRAELRAMIEGAGLRKGDTLRVRALSDLGQGAESKRMQKAVSDIGAVLEVVAGSEAPRKQGRPPRLKPSDEQKVHLCEIWYSPAPMDHVLTRAADIMGAEVDRNKLNYWCGPRDGSQKSTKLK